MSDNSLQRGDDANIKYHAIWIDKMQALRLHFIVSL
jgi:hypothetical protein